MAEAPHKAWPIPARVERTPITAAGGRALFVGDAARASDPMTGEGIGQALETGVLAADAIDAGGAFDAPGAARYERAVRRSLAVDNRLAALLSRALSHRKGARGAVRIAGPRAWTRRNFARWLFEDYPRAVLLTPTAGTAPSSAIGLRTALAPRDEPLGRLRPGSFWPRTRSCRARRRCRGGGRGRARR